MNNTDMKNLIEALSLLSHNMQVLNKKIDHHITVMANRNLEVNNRLRTISNKIDALDDQVYKMKKQLDTHVIEYSNEELAHLKENMSWKRLSDRTGLTINTLRYRVNAYKKKEVMK